MKKFLLFFLLVFSFFLTSIQAAHAQSYTINAESKEVWQETDNGKCGFFTGCSVAGEDVEINISGISLSDGTQIEDGTALTLVKWIGKGTACFDLTFNASPPNQPIRVENGAINITIPSSYVKAQCQYSLHVEHHTLTNEAGPDDNYKRFFLTTPYSPSVQAECSATQCEEDLGIISSSSYELCAQIQAGTPQYDACFNCFTSGGVWTAVGCIPSEPESVIKVVITIGLALGGGVVLIMILVGSFMLSVSQGDPNKTKEAKEIITSAIIGLLFVIFSVTLLQFIGVSVLQIPGFGE